MLDHFRQLDRLLRGEATSTSALRLGTILVSSRKVAQAALVLAVVYGFCMAVFSLVNGNDALLQRMISTVIKVPLLFFLTLLVTFPSLYLFNALVGSRLAVGEVMRLLLSSLGIMVALLASFGPIVAFFSVSTTSYSFMLLLNVVCFAVAGGLGLRFMMRTLERVTTAGKEKRKKEREEEPVDEGRPEAEPDVPFAELEAALAPARDEQGGLDGEPERENDPKVRMVFRIWIVVFGLVGAQMGWVLRPFVGDPNLPFRWLRPRESSFFEAVGRALLELITG